MGTFDILVVGSGHGGTHAAATLRSHGFTGSIGLAAAEDEPAYQRPPLSKAYLSGDMGRERILLRPRTFWAEHDVDVLGGRRIEVVDTDRHHAVTDDGTPIGFGSLIWAAGSAARTLECPGRELAGIRTLRSRADADAVAADLPSVSQVLVVGGGYLGLEVAAALTKLGRQVTLVEPMDRVLSRVCAEPVSRLFEREHRRHGVDLRLGVAVAAFRGAAGRVASAVLTDGSAVPAQLVILAIGARPVVGPLRAAGVRGDDGVDVDADGRTSVPGVFAVGDCAAQPSRFAGGARVRLESVQNAVDQASAAAAALAGVPRPVAAPPTFWSDQYDLKLRSVGVTRGCDATVVRGDPESRSFSVVYLRGGRIAAIDSVNVMRDFAQGRGLVAAAASVEPSRLADPDTPLRELLLPVRTCAPAT